MSPATESPIGGYFGEEPATKHGHDHLRDAIGYESARVAIADVLRRSGVARVAAPGYLCGVVYAALAAAGIAVRRFPLGPERTVPADLQLEAGEWLICVDYFGLGSAAVAEAVARFGGHRVLVDASQALFHEPSGAAATIYSPRKFLGLPDGGFALGTAVVSHGYRADEAASRRRCAHLLARREGDVSGGYLLFQQAEQSLCDQPPRAMSHETLQRFRRVDLDSVRRRRLANHHRLADRLEQLGLAVLRPAAADVPMCCPVRIDQARGMRERLAAEGIFCARYWPDAPLTCDDVVGTSLVDETLFLPCDQRYREREMDRIADALQRLRETR